MPLQLWHINTVISNQYSSVISYEFTLYFFILMLHQNSVWKNVLFRLGLTNISNNDLFKRYPHWVTQMYYRFYFLNIRGV